MPPNIVEKDSNYGKNSYINNWLKFVFIYGFVDSGDEFHSKNLTANIGKMV